MAAPQRFSARRDRTEAKTFVLEYDRQIPDETAEGGIRIDPQEDTFTVVAVAPAGVLLDFTAAADGGARSAAALTAFLAGVLVDEDVSRFQTLVRDKAVMIPIETLGEIAMWLAQEYAGRPTLPS